MTPSDGERRPGRPRKWADDAERGRAYRARKARQLAEPLALRRTVQELRVALRETKRALGRERRTVDQLTRQLAQLTVRSATAETRARSQHEQLERQLAQLRRRAETAEYRAEGLANQLQRSRAAAAPTPRPTSVFELTRSGDGPQLNRAQWRALERRH